MSQPRVLLVPALPVEAKAILSFFDDLEGKSAPSGASYLLGNRKIFSTRLGQALKERWSFLIASPTGAGNLEISRALQRLLPECKPRIVALIGCAGGFPPEIAPFDVVVPPRVDYIARSKVGETVELRPQQELCSPVFVDHCKTVQLLDLWHHYLLPDVTNAPINVYFEPIVCGETVLVNSRSQFFDSARSASPKAVAIEMESYGFLSVCREHKVEAAVLRGISDTLDNKNQLLDQDASPQPGLDRAQYKATRHAAALFFATLDFINVNAFSDGARRARAEMTEVSLVLDAELHDMDQIQSDLFDLFKKYGIRNFSFKPANSVRIDYEADLHAMHIFAALVKAGIVRSFAGFDVLDVQVLKHRPADPKLADLLGRIDRLSGASAKEALKILQMENWTAEHPGLAAIVVDALKHQLDEDERAAKTRNRRILYPRDAGQEPRIEAYLGRKTFPAVVVTQPAALREELGQWEPGAASHQLTGWFLGQLVDREIGADILIEHAGQRLFYSWPSFPMLFRACNLSERAFIDCCMDEWRDVPQKAYPTLLEVLYGEKLDRLSRNQLQGALAGRPATLTKAIQLLLLASRILLLNGLPVKGCIVPSLSVLVFNGQIAGDGAVERMLLTGMAGDLTTVAAETGLSLVAVRNAIRGCTLPHRAASELAEALERRILRNTRLRATHGVLKGRAKPGRSREAVDLAPDAVQRYLRP